MSAKHIDDFDVLFDAIRSFTVRRFGEQPETLRVVLPSGKVVELPIPRRLELFCPEESGRYTESSNATPSVAPSRQAATTITTDSPPPCTHSEDWRVVVWHGVRFDLTPVQGQIVRQLWEAHQTTIPDVAQSELFKNADSDSTRMSDLFRTAGVIGRLVISCGSGRYRLTTIEEMDSRSMPGEMS